VKHVAKVCQDLAKGKVDTINEFCELPVNPFTEEEQKRLENWLDRVFTWARLKDLQSEKECANEG
jgi:hypothetical protein